MSTKVHQNPLRPAMHQCPSLCQILSRCVKRCTRKALHFYTIQCIGTQGDPLGQSSSISALMNSKTRTTKVPHLFIYLFTSDHSGTTHKQKTKKKHTTIKPERRRKKYIYNKKKCNRGGVGGLGETHPLLQRSSAHANAGTAFSNSNFIHGAKMC